MHSKISHMWRNVIMKMKTTNNLIFKLFNPLSTSSAKAFGSLFCAGTRHLYLVSSPQGLGTVFPLSICVAFCCKHILSICMKYMDLTGADPAIKSDRSIVAEGHRRGRRPRPVGGSGGIHFLCNSIGNRNHIGVMQVKGIKLCNNSPFVNFGAAIV